jgi:hypothetical protein
MNTDDATITTVRRAIKVLEDKGGAYYTPVLSRDKLGILARLVIEVDAAGAIHVEGNPLILIGFPPVPDRFDDMLSAVSVSGWSVDRIRAEAR